MLAERERRKEALTNRNTSSIMEFFQRWVDRAADNLITGKSASQATPSSQEFKRLIERFYFEVIDQGIKASREEMQAQQGKKRLSQRLGLPKSLRDMERLFRDRRAWPKVMKRSDATAKRIFDDYKRRLEKKFSLLLPKIQAGEIAPADAKAQMRKAWGASKARIETIFRTETTNYFTSTQLAYFEGEPSIIGYLFDSVRDSSRTPICRSRHGLIYKPGSALLAKNKPPCHWNCRSDFIALADTPENRKMVADPSRDPSKVSVVPLPRGWKAA